MIVDDPVEPLIEALRAVHWNSPITVIIEQATGPVENPPPATAPIYCGSRKLRRDEPALPQLIEEIHMDLDQLERKHPHITHYRIGLLKVWRDTEKVYNPNTFEPMDRCSMIRYSKFIYTQ